ncbi:BIRC7_8 [Mytilus coruscus]|uniref:BIRC7_8 n=1 Tax=Mytilus coruscus TaxID=42192 RepID=A0A6J8AJ52_MYTCO|nr:BIRC7_8 [Mytilus coruscus]
MAVPINDKEHGDEAIVRDVIHLDIDNSNIGNGQFTDDKNSKTSTTSKDDTEKTFIKQQILKAKFAAAVTILSCVMACIKTFQNEFMDSLQNTESYLSWYKNRKKRMKPNMPKEDYFIPKSKAWLHRFVRSFHFYPKTFLKTYLLNPEEYNKFVDEQKSKHSSISKEAMQFEWSRLSSFASYPKTCHSVIKLAGAGFYYDGNGDEVTCYFCGLKHKDWKPTDDPKQIHKQKAPICPFVIQNLSEISKQDDVRTYSTYGGQASSGGACGNAADSENLSVVSEKHYGSVKEQHANEARAHYENTFTFDRSQEISVTVDRNRENTVTDVRNRINTITDDMNRENSVTDDMTRVNTVTDVRNRINTITDDRNRENTVTDDRNRANTVTDDRNRENTVTDDRNREHTVTFDRNITSSRNSELTENQVNNESAKQRESTENVSSQIRTNQTQTFYSRNNTTGLIRIPAINVAQQRTSTHAVENTARSSATNTTSMSIGICLEKPKYPKYAIKTTRLSSFDNWPLYLSQTPEELINAGFFYTGTEDHCRCFFCGGGLRRWEEGDLPWTEHARWYPKCPFVIQCKGEKFIDDVQQGKNPEITKNVAEKDHKQSPSGLNGYTNNPAVQTILDFGYECAVVKTAYTRLKESGIHDITASLLLETICEKEESENYHTISNQTIAARNTTQEKEAENIEHSNKTPENIEQIDPTLELSIRSLEEENRNLKDQQTCKICLDEPVAIVFLPLWSHGCLH